MNSPITASDFSNSHDPYVHALLVHVPPEHGESAFRSACMDLADLDTQGADAEPLSRETRTTCRALLQRDDLHTWGALRPHIPTLQRRLVEVRAAIAIMITLFHDTAKDNSQHASRN